MNRLNRDISIPLYLQLAQSIEDDIQSRRVQPGAKILSEAASMEKYSVSRITVRKAMQYLSEKGLIVRRRGMGSFVRRTDVQQKVEDLFGIYQSLIKIDPGIEMELLKYEEESPPPEVREKLQLAPNEKVLKFIRRYHLNNEALLAANVYVPMRFATKLTREKVSKKESFRLLAEEAGVEIESVDMWIRVAKATPPMSEYLHVSTNSPILELRRLSLSVGKNPIQYSIVEFPGESYELTAHITSDLFSNQLGIGKYD